MAKKSKNTTEIKTTAYRHSDQTRKNIPLAKIEAEGRIPKIGKQKYFYNPHLSPRLRYDPTGNADILHGVAEKVSKYLSKDEMELLKGLVEQNQPWLEWTEKKEQHDKMFFEVDPVALHIHERISSQAILRASQRKDIEPELFANPEFEYKKEIEFYRHEMGWANRLILGDSLQVMSSLAKRENLTGKIQMIYIDPPYGIKFASNFQPNIGNRDVKDIVQDLTREPEMVKAYRDTWQLGVHSYLSYLRDRILICRELLNDSGSIFIQIDDNNLHRVRILLDEIFGPDNFQAVITFRSSVPLKSTGLSSIGDYVIWYSKDFSKIKRYDLYLWREESDGNVVNYCEESNGQRRPLSPGEKMMKSDSSKDIRFFATDNLVSSGYTPTCIFETEYEGRRFFPSSNKSWKTNRDGMERLKKAFRVNASGKTLRAMAYLDDYPVQKISNFWTDTTGSSDKKYVVETATKVIQRCMLMTTDPGDIILDPTCGSGASAFTAEQWGRRWITIDTSRVSITIARQKILTSKFDYYRLKYPSKGVGSGFKLEAVPHITLKSIAQNINLDPIFNKYDLVLDEIVLKCNSLLKDTSKDIKDRLILKYKDKESKEGKKSIKDSDKRRWLLPPSNREGGKLYETVSNDFEGWYHWEVPFDMDPDWPDELKKWVTEYRRIWRIRLDEINKCIAANTDNVELVDHPEIESNILRVSGPFTVEGVRPEELSIGENGLFDSTPNDFEADDIERSIGEIQNLNSYLKRMVDLIRKDGVTFPNNIYKKFGAMEPLFENNHGFGIHAEAYWADSSENKSYPVAIAFGPQYGPVTARQVEDLIRSSRMYDELLIAGFNFNAEATEIIQESTHPKLKIHMAHIRPDVSPGMDGLLKDTPNSQLFSVFGLPEIKLEKKGDNYVVELKGVDIYDPLKGEVFSAGADKVSAWFLDCDYDGRCFCISQAFFPHQDAWDKIAKSLGSKADEEVFEAFNSTVSIPFKSGKNLRIAIKVIDPRGNEVTTTAKLN